MKSNSENLTSFNDHLIEQYGEPGTPQRDQFEQEFEAFKLGIMLYELRKEKGLTQKEVAVRCGTKKNYISRIETTPAISGCLH